jgi:hypothetical protein
MQSGPQVDSEAINSDLDDSDTEGEEDAEEGTAGETDIVFCTYDKVSILAISSVLILIQCLAGGACEKQMEVRAEGWYDPYKREGLSICQVYGVRQPTSSQLFVDCMISLGNSNGSQNASAVDSSLSRLIPDIAFHRITASHPCFLVAYHLNIGSELHYMLGQFLCCYYQCHCCIDPYLWTKAVFIGGCFHAEDTAMIRVQCPSQFAV